MEDEDYRVLVHGGQQAYLSQRGRRHAALKSLWIYRFYDTAADTFGAAAPPYSLPVAAKGLLTFIDLVRSKTGAAKGLAGRTFDGRADLPQHDPEGVPRYRPPGRRCR